MTINTNFLGITAVAIQPVKAKKTDANDSTFLGVRSRGDNFSTHCNLYYAYLSDDGTVNLDGNLIINGDDYQKWTGDNTFPFTFAASKLGETII